jgi:hypothetical protein
VTQRWPAERSIPGSGTRLENPKIASVAFLRGLRVRRSGEVRGKLEGGELSRQCAEADIS